VSAAPKMKHVYKKIKLGDAGNASATAPRQLPPISRDQIKKKSLKELKVCLRILTIYKKCINSKNINFRLPISLHLPNIHCTLNRHIHGPYSEGWKTSNGRNWRQCGQGEFEQRNTGEWPMGRQKTKLNKKRKQKAHLNTSPIHTGAHGMTLRTKKRNPSKDPQGSPGGGSFVGTMFSNKTNFMIKKFRIGCTI